MTTDQEQRTHHKESDSTKEPVRNKKLGKGAVAGLATLGVVIGGGVAGVVMSMLPRNEVVAAPPRPSNEITSTPLPTPETEPKPTTTPSEVESTPTAPENKPYSEEVVEQNNEDVNSFLNRPVEERMVLVSALLAQADEKFPDRYVDVEHDLDLHKMNPLKVASESNSNEDIVRQHKYLENAAALGTNLGALKDDDFSIETSQKVAGALTVSTPQEGVNTHVSEITDRVTNAVHESGGNTSTSYEIIMNQEQNEENFSCETTDGKERICRDIVWKTIDRDSEQVIRYRFALVEFNDYQGRAKTVWIPDSGTANVLLK